MAAIASQPRSGGSATVFFLADVALARPTQQSSEPRSKPSVHDVQLPPTLTKRHRSNRDRSEAPLRRYTSHLEARGSGKNEGTSRHFRWNRNSSKLSPKAPTTKPVPNRTGSSLCVNRTQGNRERGG